MLHKDKKGLKQECLLQAAMHYSTFETRTINRFAFFTP